MERNGGRVWRPITDRGRAPETSPQTGDRSQLYPQFETSPGGLDGKAAERLVFNQCTTDRAAKLFAIEVGFFLFKNSVRLQVLLGVKNESAAMQGIGARLGDDVNEWSGGVTVLRGELVGDDLEFLDRILGNQANRPANNIVVKVAAIDTDPGTSRRGSARHNAPIKPLGGIVGRRWCGAGDEVSQLLKIPVINWQVGNLYLGDRFFNLGGRGVNLSRQARNLDLLHPARKLDREVGGNRVSYGEGGIDRLITKPCFLGFHFVPATRQQVEAIETF